MLHTTVKFELDSRQSGSLIWWAGVETYSRCYVLFLHEMLFFCLSESLHFSNLTLFNCTVYMAEMKIMRAGKKYTVVKVKSKCELY